MVTERLRRRSARACFPPANATSEASGREKNDGGERKTPCEDRKCAAPGERQPAPRAGRVRGALPPSSPAKSGPRSRARPVPLLWRSLQPRARPHGDCRLHSNLIHSHSDILSRVLASSPWRRSASPKLGTQRDIDDLRCLCVQVITMSTAPAVAPSWCSRRAAPARPRRPCVPLRAPRSPRRRRARGGLRFARVCRRCHDRGAAADPPERAGRA